MPNACDVEQSVAEASRGADCRACRPPLAVPCGSFADGTGNTNVFTVGTFFFALGDLDGDSDVDIVAIGGVHTFDYQGLLTSTQRLPFIRRIGREASFAESFRNDGTGSFSRMQPSGSFLFAPSEVRRHDSSSTFTLHSSRMLSFERCPACNSN